MMGSVRMMRARMVRAQRKMQQSAARLPVASLAMKRAAARDGVSGSGTPLALVETPNAPEVVGTSETMRVGKSC
ncbi:hypothetical protein [Stutzerimonas stutzeri]|uniref:hypothetical protein n=1 Tax=Stutzerimonas stutzeri TaxID=316 RepID=UPI0011AF04C8|nr:hypothetical protein [Stutzerimonas stutzeri]